MIYDGTKIVDGHVVWELLTADEQADLLVNFPHQGGLNDEQTEKWLDGAYMQRTGVSIGVSPEQGP